MIISKLDTGSFIYYNLHVEEVITSNFIEDINLGIYCDRLQSITMERVIADIRASVAVGSNIAFDFRKLEAIQSNLNTYFTELRTEGYKIAFLNVTHEIVLALGYDFFKHPDNRVADITFFDKITLDPRIKEGYKRFYFYERDNNFYPDDFKIEDTFKEFFKTSLMPYSDKHEEQHTSSFVYLTSYINVKKFISHEKPLCIYAIYLLAAKILREWRKDGPIPFYSKEDKEKQDTPILVCQSLNSAYIVSILSNLLKLDVLILDKIGPINKLYNSLDKNIIENKNYIVVSDLVCLGTEVKIVKNIIQFLGGFYLGNVSLIKTETLKKADIKRKDATLAIFSIDKTNYKDFDYQIKTDLSDE
ncbi:hypothetical protein SAMN05443633_11223 [Chryseobacterium arachidis]|uniref:Uncharacterized protein n=1 Tax=Chryseobacterium arachidis TaxID=1416778 RepID=A0A1M5I6V9_9FLAO|nr:hypothetical protein [Chryseobacterium arachidis]SHG24098.1 hypothetical protein SAMN05443633_11223 [Chryseobacterium arachidis]